MEFLTLIFIFMIIAPILYLVVYMSSGRSHSITPTLLISVVMMIAMFFVFFSISDVLFTGNFTDMNGSDFNFSEFFEPYEGLDIMPILSVVAIVLGLVLCVSFVFRIASSYISHSDDKKERKKRRERMRKKFEQSKKKKEIPTWEKVEEEKKSEDVEVSGWDRLK